MQCPDLAGRPLVCAPAQHQQIHKVSSACCVHIQPGKLMLITEYLERGDLCSALEKDRSDPRQFTWWKPAVGEGRKIAGLNKRIALDLARGLAFLHQRKVQSYLLCRPDAVLKADTGKLASYSLLSQSLCWSQCWYKHGSVAWCASCIFNACGPCQTEWYIR